MQSVTGGPQRRHCWGHDRPWQEQHPHSTCKHDIPAYNRAMPEPSLRTTNHAAPLYVATTSCMCVVLLLQVLRQAGRPSEAQNLSEEALSLLQNQLGSEHPRVAAQLMILGQLAAQQNKQAVAEQTFRKALQVGAAYGATCLA